MFVVTSIHLPCGYDVLKPITPSEMLTGICALGIIYHNFFVGLCTNQHFLQHCLKWILDLFFGSYIKKCQHNHLIVMKALYDVQFFVCIWSTIGSVQMIPQSLCVSYMHHWIIQMIWRHIMHSSHKDIISFLEFTLILIRDIFLR
jgi:hypothetical protein